jgi:type VI protein secretion system component VasK
MNKKKTISFDINPEDVRKLTNEILTLVFTRFSTNWSTGLNELSSAVNSQTKVEILVKLQSLMDNCHKLNDELDGILPLIDELNEYIPASDDDVN